VIAHTVAAPVAGRRVVVRDSPYVDLDGFIVLVVPRGGPLLPNGVMLTGDLGTGAVAIEGAHVWDPTLTLPADRAALGATMLAALGRPAQPSLAAGDPAAAGAELIGRGEGLTPEGDDVVAGAAAVLAAAGWSAEWVDALLGSDLRRRTTALSATLLELAAQGMGPEPLQAVLAGRPGALERLLALGHSSGRAYALGAATALTLLDA
jgi:uncharacterized protein DUF2877